MGQYLTTVENHGPDNAKPVEPVNTSSAGPKITNPSEVSAYLLKEALELPPSERCIQSRVHKLTGSEVREIVLSVCAESTHLKYRVLDVIERREGRVEKGDSLGVRLQGLKRSDVAALVLYILELDETCSTHRIIEQLVDCFEERDMLLNELY